MFKVNEDKSIYLTRGDVVVLAVSADDNGKPFVFSAGDVLRFKVFAKKNCSDVVLEKDFVVKEETETVQVFLESAETKIGEEINKPKDYWYEVELNPDTYPQTIVGYDDEGAKVFRLFPEGAELKGE